MGSQVKVKCKCGYTKEVSVGGGRLNYNTIEYFPCYCNNCHDIVEGNLKEKRLSCPNCNSQKIIPYNNKHLIGQKGNQIVEQSLDNILTDGLYFCPKCNLMTLQFLKSSIIWD